jgi:hypothetical protein
MACGRTEIMTMRNLIYAGILASASVLSGCAVAIPATAALTAAPNLPDSSTAKTPGVETKEINLGALKPRKLAAGECGLFLWASAGDQSLVFYGARNGAAHAVLGEREVKLVRAKAEGREVLGQFEQQTYAYGAHHIELKLQFEQREGLGRGAVVQSGILRLTQANGWDQIFPVGGLVGCEG